MTTESADEPVTYEEVTDWLRREHLVTVGGNVSWNWACSCGAYGVDTEYGRALQGRDMHLRAARRRYAHKHQSKATR